MIFKLYTSLFYNEIWHPHCPISQLNSQFFFCFCYFQFILFNKCGAQETLIGTTIYQKSHFYPIYFPNIHNNTLLGESISSPDRPTSFVRGADCESSTTCIPFSLGAPSTAAILLFACSDCADSDWTVATPFSPLSLRVDSPTSMVKVSDSPYFPFSSFLEGSHVRRALCWACDNRNTHFPYVASDIHRRTTSCITPHRVPSV